MGGRVTMAHPDLPDRPIVVDEVSVPHHQAAGWYVTDQPQQLTPPAKRLRTTPRKDEA